LKSYFINYILDIANRNAPECIQSKIDELQKENTLLKEQIKLYPESDYILKIVKEQFDKLK